MEKNRPNKFVLAIIPVDGDFLVTLLRIADEQVSTMTVKEEVKDNQVIDKDRFSAFVEDKLLKPMFDSGKKEEKKKGKLRHFTG